MTERTEFASDLGIAPNAFGDDIIVVGEKLYQLCSNINGRARYFVEPVDGSAPGEHMIIFND